MLFSYTTKGNGSWRDHHKRMTIVKVDTTYGQNIRVITTFPVEGLEYTEKDGRYSYPVSQFIDWLIVDN